MLQWGHRLSAMDTGTRLSGHPDRNGASMGPPPFGDGNFGCAPQPVPHSCASMGPPPFGDGNIALATTSRSPCRLLQWGHRLSAMETVPEPSLRQRQGLASMGPSPFGDGNPTCHQPATLILRLLQWGHRLSAMETWTCQSWSKPKWGCFNGATAFRRWKRRQREGATGGGTASMGPPPFGDGNTTTRP